tara:strand:+ start:6935 stop:7492 length:558 start_codon:yes stop_codon:yes gene_type:complete
MNVSSRLSPASTRVQPRIVSDRLVLRPLSDQDAGLLARHAGDIRVARGTRSIAHPLPAGAIDAFLRAARAPDREEDVWAIDGTPAGQPSLLGVVSLKALDRNQSQIGYWVAPDFWSAGIASNAVRMILSENPHANRTIFAEVFQDNPASARVLTQAGFEYISDAEAFSLARNEAVPTWTYLRRMG